jgi:predicted DNA-binding transcriptional regulator YafY
MNCGCGAMQFPRTLALDVGVSLRTLYRDIADLAGRSSTRLARPLGLTVFDSVWLLTLCCETAHAFRHLRVDRIDGIRVTAKRFRDERGRRFSDCLAQEGHQRSMPFSG